MFSPDLHLFISHILVVEVIVDEEAEKEERRREYVRTYVSPWERAMKGNEELKATMKSYMPGPIQIQPDLPQYKSFNKYTHTHTPTLTHGDAEQC